ncbi:Ribosomal RNA small subunit methyltransferase J [Beijerinckiaceae bacterium RH AL1]|nr:class I SAM-dependent methyltransferase [Beijerinckiaceae bacterium]VVB49737.1 Ribosomal RNA small subunit methyltransferase J [Beijerinckiaceae bacterium RH CH11]VVB49814.1 Ribosomal RNA small subunit methyltransferase J [Beijerinckiaceae bacterium RH AL8]VVC57051.1 Ribosomal RNA small subunit methyltransferase J [Beijerinckiaceae bacterium RH AL1]
MTELRTRQRFDPPRDDPPVVDFLGGAVGHRHRSGAGRGHALVRAVGLKPGRPLRVVDATAGLGRDAFLLASLGAEVTLVERVPAVQRLLAEAIAALAEAGAEHAAIAGRMTLAAGDARKILPGLAADVVTVDPMHPARLGSALVKAEMRRLRALVGDDPDSAELIAAALASPAARVVVKWPLRAPLPPGVPAPSHSHEGKTVRYDVFVRPGVSRAGVRQSG